MGFLSMITGAQLRMARHALRWTVSELQIASQVSQSTIKRIEAEDGRASSTPANMLALQRVMEAAGIEFIGTPEDAPGIRIHAK